MAFIVGAIVGAGASLIGGAMASSAASKAAKAQAQSADKAAKLQSESAREALALEKQIYEEGVKRQQPFYEAGVAGQNRLVTLLGLGGDPNAEGYGSLMKSFSMDDFRADPGYNFRMKEGLKSLDATAAARGGLISGNALRAAQAFGQDLGSQEYQNAYNRYQTNRANIIDPLQKQAGQGGTVATTLGSAGAGYASGAGNTMMTSAANIGNLNMAAGNARASGYTGAADAWNRALGGAAGTINSNMMYNQMFGKGYDPYSNYANLGGGGQVLLPPSRPA
jgi:hypothetical protein